ncbi:MAG: DUF5666 domain-containing protein [Janthinobacterium lividum]
MRRPPLLVTTILGASAFAIASCAAPPPPPAAHAGAVGGMCRIGPHGGPLLAERGIGGTGGVAPQPVPATGAAPGGPSPLPRPGDRGIGGTGVVGVITGFGSVCVDGLEIVLDQRTSVAIDGAPAPTMALRAGQLVSLVAADADAVPRTTSLAVRHEVVGPVQAGGIGSLVVAGQRVLVEQDTQGDRRPSLGARVAVSGLRNASGAVVATRIDAAAPEGSSSPSVLVHGALVRDTSGLRLDGLRVRPAAGVPVPAPGPVTATGRLQDGTLVAEGLESDLLAASPPAFFGSDVGRYVVESYVDPAGQLLLGQDLHVQEAGSGTRSVVAFEREAGGVAAVSLRSAAAATASLSEAGHALGAARMFPAGAAAAPAQAGSDPSSSPAAGSSPHDGLSGVGQAGPQPGSPGQPGTQPETSSNGAAAGSPALEGFTPAPVSGLGAAGSSGLGGSGGSFRQPPTNGSRASPLPTAGFGSGPSGGLSGSGGSPGSMGGTGGLGHGH